MKKHLIYIFLFIANFSFAQVASFRQFNEPYNDLRNDNAPFVNFKWDDSFSFDIDLSEPITFDTIVGINLLIQANGYASLSSPFSTNNSNLFIVPYFVTNLMDRSLKTNSFKAISPISYKYDLVNGEKVIKVQWKNVGFQYGSPNDSANFQFWLFTESQKVQYRYGESHITNLDSIVQVDTMQIGIEIYSDVIDKSTLLVGNPSNISISTNPLAGFFGIPPAGTVYEFTSLSLGINNKKTSKINYKIEQDELVVLGVPADLLNVELMDLLGNIVASSSSERLSIYSLNSGVYILRLQTNKQNITQKIFISH